MSGWWLTVKVIFYGHFAHIIFTLSRSVFIDLSIYSELANFQFKLLRLTRFYGLYMSINI